MSNSKQELQEFTGIMGLTHKYFSDGGTFQEGNNLLLLDDYIECGNSLVDTGSSVFVDLILHSVEIGTKLLCFGSKGNVYKLESGTRTKIYTDTNAKKIISSAVYGSYVYWTTDTYCSRCAITNIDSDITADTTQSRQTFDVVNNYHYATGFFFGKKTTVTSVSNNYLFITDGTKIYQYYETDNTYDERLEFSVNEIIQNILYTGEYIFIITKVDGDTIIYNWNGSSDTLKPVQILNGQSILGIYYYRGELFLIDQNNELILRFYDDDLLGELSLINPVSIGGEGANLLFASGTDIIRHQKQGKTFAMIPYLNLPTNIDTGIILEYGSDTFISIQVDSTTYKMYKKSVVVEGKLRGTIIKNSNFHQNKMTYVVVNYELLGDSSITVNLSSNGTQFFSDIIIDSDKRIYKARINENFDDLDIEIILTPGTSNETPKFLGSQVEYSSFTFL